MSDGTERTDAARLDELAGVTKAYARLSGPASGLAMSATGAWLLVAEALLRVSPRTGELFLVCAPIASIALFAAARTYYQRHGTVVGTPPEGFEMLRPLWFAIVFMMSLIAIERQFEGVRQGDELIAVAAVLAAAMVAVAIPPSRVTDLVVIGVLMTFAAMAGHRRTPEMPAESGWAEITVGILYVIGGVVIHHQYRRVERRLAALKVSAP